MQEILDAEKEERKRKREAEKATKKAREDLQKKPEEGATAENGPHSEEAADVEIADG